MSGHAAAGFDRATAHLAAPFAALDLDAFDLIGANGIRAVDATIPNAAFSPRGNEEAPLGALIVRWIQAHIDRPSDRFGWQYLDAADIHTVAFVDDDDELRFINIFGQVDGGRRVYRLRALAEAQEQYEKQRQADRVHLDEQGRQKVLSLATDLPRLWHDPATSDQDRKRMARLLIEDVTLHRAEQMICLLYTSPSPRDRTRSRMPSSA